MPARRRSTRSGLLLAALCLALLGAAAAGASSGRAAGGNDPAAAERLVIGRSVRGRPIVAIHGTGPGSPPGTVSAAPLKVLIVGCIHGDETAGIRVARRLAAEQ